MLGPESWCVVTLQALAWDGSWQKLTETFQQDGLQGLYRGYGANVPWPKRHIFFLGGTRQKQPWNNHEKDMTKRWTTMKNQEPAIKKDRVHEEVPNIAAQHPTTDQNSPTAISAYPWTFLRWSSSFVTIKQQIQQVWFYLFSPAKWAINPASKNEPS